MHSKAVPGRRAAAVLDSVLGLAKQVYQLFSLVTFSLKQTFKHRVTYTLRILFLATCI